MAKGKITLSVDEELLKEARSNTIKRGLSLSNAFETLLKSFTKREIEDIAKGLDITLKYVSFDDVIKMRKAGRNAGKAVRGMRDAREKSILGY